MKLINQKMQQETERKSLSFTEALGGRSRKDYQLRGRGVVLE